MTLLGLDTVTAGPDQLTIAPRTSATVRLMTNCHLNWAVVVAAAVVASFLSNKFDVKFYSRIKPRERERCHMAQYTPVYGKREREKRNRYYRVEIDQT